MVTRRPARSAAPYPGGTRDAPRRAAGPPAPAGSGNAMPR